MRVGDCVEVPVHDADAVRAAVPVWLLVVLDVAVVVAVVLDDTPRVCETVFAGDVVGVTDAVRLDVGVTEGVLDKLCAGVSDGEMVGVPVEVKDAEILAV